MTAIEKTISELRSILEDPMWRQFDRLMNDVKIAEPYEDLKWLCSKRRVLVLAYNPLLVEEKGFLQWRASITGEKVILTNELVDHMFRKAQATQRLMESVLQWIEMSRKKK